MTATALCLVGACLILGHNASGFCGGCHTPVPNLAAARVEMLVLFFLLPLAIGAFLQPVRAPLPLRPHARPPVEDDPASWSFERLQEEKAFAQARQKQQAGAVGNAFLAVVVALAVRLACSPAEIRREYICPAAIGGASKLPTDRSVYGGDCTPAGELLLKVIFAPVKLPFTEGYWTPPARVGGAPV